MKIKKDCPVCFSQNIKFIYTGYDYLYETTNDSYDMFECRSCKAIFLNPFPDSTETSKFYPAHYYSYDTNKPKGFFAKIKDDIVRSKMEPKTKFSLMESLLIKIFESKYSGLPLYKKENATFLDIGCGSGTNLALLSKFGWNCYGIELHEKAVQFAKKNNLQVTQDSLESSDFTGKKFDCIRIWHVFEHLTDPHAALKKISKHLTNDGEILMAVPNTDSWPRKLFGPYWYGLDAPRHIINYSPRTLKQILPIYNLKISNITYASCGPYVGSLSHFLKAKFDFKVNLINNLFLIAITAPLDFITDHFKQGDTIFLTIKKYNTL